MPYLYMCLFPSCCFVSEPTTCHQDHPNLLCLDQISTEKEEDLNLMKSELLMQSPDRYQLPPYIDQIKKLRAIQPQGGSEPTDKEICRPILLASHTNQKAEVVPQPPESQQPVPFLKLLAGCEERLGLEEQLNTSIQDTSQQQDLQPGTDRGTKLVYREYVHTEHLNYLIMYTFASRKIFFPKVLTKIIVIFKSKISSL